MSVGAMTYATDQGLGILAKSFYDAGIVTDFLIVNHDSRPNHYDWYPQSSVIKAPLDRSIAQRFIATVDTMLFFETPFLWELINDCKVLGTKSVLMPMHECMPDPLPTTPDLILCPSALEMRLYGGVFIPVPASTVPFNLRKTATTFVHNAGNLGLKGRNGTFELLMALPHIKSPIKLIVRSQTDEIKKLMGPQIANDERLDLRIGSVPHDELWEEGDVFVFPEKFNGLSLPLQEARAAGMLVMAADRFPMNSWLPRDPLVPVEYEFFTQIRNGWVKFKEAKITPQAIAATIDDWFCQDIEEYSRQGLHWAHDNGWAVLGPRYKEALK